MTELPVIFLPFDTNLALTDLNFVIIHGFQNSFTCNHIVLNKLVLINIFLFYFVDCIYLTCVNVSSKASIDTMFIIIIKNELLTAYSSLC